MMAFKKLLLFYIRNEMIRGLTWTGSGFEGLWVGGTPPPSNFPLGSPLGRCMGRYLLIWLAFISIQEHFQTC